MANFIDDPKLRQQWRDNQAQAKAQQLATDALNNNSAKPMPRPGGNVTVDALQNFKPGPGGIDPWFSPPKSPEEAKQRQQQIEQFWKDHPDGTMTFGPPSVKPTPGYTGQPVTSLKPGETRKAPDGVNTIGTMIINGKPVEVTTLIGVPKPGTKFQDKFPQAAGQLAQELMGKPGGTVIPELGKGPDGKPTFNGKPMETPVQWDKNTPHPWAFPETVGKAFGDSIAQGQKYVMPQVVSPRGSADPTYQSWNKWWTSYAGQMAGRQTPPISAQAVGQVLGNRRNGR